MFLRQTRSLRGYDMSLTYFLLRLFNDIHSFLKLIFVFFYYVLTFPFKHIQGNIG